MHVLKVQENSTAVKGTGLSEDGKNKSQTWLNCSIQVSDICQVLLKD